jgi:glycosyltransferase involved in cell wall biosynthesis
MNLKKKISVVTPFFNEQDGVNLFYREMVTVFLRMPHVEFEVICVDDGSDDGTLNKLIQISIQDDRFKVIEFSRNFGKEAALTAGIDAASGDAVIPIDSDLQDPPELILDMIVEWSKGAEVVLARRIDRSSDSFLKRKTAELFYRYNNKLSIIPIPENVGDYRLMDRVAVEALKRLTEKHRFMKGLFAWVGFKTVTLDYSRRPRISGETKFSGWKLWNFAIEGITSFSTLPLKLWTYIGALMAIFSFIFAIFIIVRTLILGIELPGYASLLVTVLFLGSLQLVGLGIIGEYLGRIFMESKNRPLYVIRKEYGIQK